MKTLILFTLLVVYGFVTTAQEKIISVQTVKSFLMIDKSPLGVNTLRFDREVIEAVKMILAAEKTVIALRFIADFTPYTGNVRIIGILPGGQDLKLPEGSAYNPCPRSCDWK